MRSTDILDIDVTKMQDVAYLAGQATARITEAEQMLNRIRNHTNWRCREKYVLNGNAEEMKKKMHALQDKAELFYRAMHNAADSLSAAENEISGLFKDVEKLIGNALSGVAAPASLIGAQISDVVNGIIGQIETPHPWQRITGIWDHINIVNTVTIASMPDSFAEHSAVLSGGGFR